MARVRTILHPTNFSECSRHAFHKALSLARQHGARLIVLHVAPPVFIYRDLETMPLRPSGYQAALREMLDLLHSEGPRVRLDYRVERGDPHVEICRLAGETECDLIVMGTNGRARLLSMVLGSLTEQVRRRARCPVLALTTPRSSPRLPEALQEKWPAAWGNRQGRYALK